MKIKILQLLISLFLQTYLYSQSNVDTSKVITELLDYLENKAESYAGKTKTVYNLNLNSFQISRQYNFTVHQESLLYYGIDTLGFKEKFYQAVSFDLKPFIKRYYKSIRLADLTLLNKPDNGNSSGVIVEDIYLSTPVFIGNKCLIIIKTHWFLDTILFIKEKDLWKRIEKTFGYPIHGWVN